MTLMWAAEHRKLVNMTFGTDNITIATMQVHLYTGMRVLPEVQPDSQASDKSSF